PHDEQMKKATNRLLDHSKRRKTAAKGSEPKLFTLPHDDSMALERVIGGEQKASAFSPLYKAYLELFQSLFPTRAEPARRVLERLEAVHEIKKELTEAGRYEEYERGLSPWSESAIHEGVVYEAEGHGKKGRRYADLMCRDD